VPRLGPHQAELIAALASMRSAGAAAGAGSGRAAHCPPCMGGRALRRPRAPRPRHAVIPAAQPDRDTIKRLNQLFYGPASPDGGCRAGGRGGGPRAGAAALLTSTASRRVGGPAPPSHVPHILPPPPPCPAPAAPFAHPDQATTSFQAPVRAPTTAAEWAPLALERLPLWRVEWVVLPCQQCVLHVHAPHYAHMFEELFAQHQPGTPLLFGHLYLPGGSRSLGDPAYRLNPDARAGHLVQLDGALADEAGATAAAAGDDAEAAAQQQQQQQQQQAGAPTVGTLMEITRAVRMLDGKLMLLATAVGRFKVGAAPWGGWVCRAGRRLQQGSRGPRAARVRLCAWRWWRGTRWLVTAPPPLAWSHCRRS